MADQPKDIQELEEIESQAVQEAAKEFDAFVSSLILIVGQGSARNQKLKKIQEQIDKMMRFSSDFSIARTYEVYMQQVSAIARMFGSDVKITQAQKKELLSLVNQMKFDLDNRISYYESLAKRIIMRQERAALREREMGYKDGLEYYSANGRDFSSDFELRDSKGRPLTTEAAMAVLVGDAIWNSGMSGRVSAMLFNDIKFGIHNSVIDDRTSDICLTLDQRKRNLETDELPPLHRHCRSWIEPIF